MTDPVLTDDEKEALLEGMSTGEIEVHSNKGPAYAEVKPFEIGPRARISSRSYPRLQHLNQEFAGRLTRQAEALLNAEATVTYVNTETCSYSSACEQNDGLSLIVEFSPKPLEGSALISLGARTVGNLVETFFGGQGNEPSTCDAASFTPGEMSVATLFGEAVLSVITDVWNPIAAVAPEVVGKHLSSGVIDSVDAGDTVINSAFRLAIDEETEVFHVLWPLNTIASLVPVLEGQKRDRDATEDARWARSLRSSVTDTVVRISSDVGRTRMTLGAIAGLAPGDVLTIGNPRQGTVRARNVPILNGRFGVHDGRYAIEAVNWLAAGTASASADSL